jgi:hypothetical protein
VPYSLKAKGLQMLRIYSFSKIGQSVFEKPASLAFIQRPTKHAPDAGALRVARFQDFFYASAFFQSDGGTPPSHTQVTQTVGATFP